MYNVFRYFSKIMNLTIWTFYILVVSQTNLHKNSAEYFPQQVNNVINTTHPTCTQGFIHVTNGSRVTHICISKLTIIGSDRGLFPSWHQAIIWTNAWILLIWPCGTYFNGFFEQYSYISIQENALENVVWKWQPFSLALNVLTNHTYHSFVTQLTSVGYDNAYQQLSRSLPGWKYYQMHTRYNVWCCYVSVLW